MMTVSEAACTHIEQALHPERSMGSTKSAMTAAAQFAALLAMRLPDRTITQKPLRLKADLIEGLRYMWHDRTIRGLLSLVVVSNSLAQPYTVLLPVFARDVLRTVARGYGLLM